MFFRVRVGGDQHERLGSGGGGTLTTKHTKTSVVPYHTVMTFFKFAF